MNKDKLTYKSYIGTVHFSDEDDIFYGRIAGIRDLVTFEGSSVKELKDAFIEAVDDYLELCEIAGKEPNKSFKGSFNIRITPELHSLAYNKSKRLGISLNQFVKNAIEKEVN